MTTLRLILGDQLNLKHSWFKTTDSSIIYCMFEMRQETDYVKHHIQKVAGFFAAMREFHLALKEQGHDVVYFKINDERNTQDLAQNLQLLINTHNIKKLEYQLPDEYRLDEQLRAICENLSISFKVYDSEHFYTKRNELTQFFQGKKQLVMENFYRHMRKKHDILMIGDQPEGGKWNFDHSNRKTWKGEPEVPEYLKFKNDVSVILADIENANITTIGRIKSNYLEYPITRQQALEQLKFFCTDLLAYFGDYQDAMHTKELNLFHSRLSFALNIKLLSAKDVVSTVLNYYRKHGEDIDISQVEGFIRQVIGWREYMRGMYWMMMPDMKNENYLNNRTKLPEFFWTGNTQMNCLKHSINNALDNAYGHHIQRLMITGNYALLTQTNPQEVDQWYLGIYADAIEWVQLPNTRGMSQFADGGKIATKPYVSSASYINKMSNYCDQCVYKKNKKIEDDACPFNSLYWNFLDDKRHLLDNNFRMKMMYSVLDKMKPELLHRIKIKAQQIISNKDAY